MSQLHLTETTLPFSAMELHHEHPQTAHQELHQGVIVCILDVFDSQVSAQEGLGAWSSELLLCCSLGHTVVLGAPLSLSRLGRERLCTVSWLRFLYTPSLQTQQQSDRETPPEQHAPCQGLS